ncbi:MULTISPECIES: hypothetical protein [Flavobacterium]|uniref:hypothetical protein n=1 Tax=Flavobacterium TaxID=237 RepID=UPI001FCCB8B3|nr:MULTISPECIES: hypothetical protein [Flavobacterium]UOK41630.1 hypothetical protein LZF87_09940 [Flavobacterium enshiense]
MNEIEKPSIPYLDFEFHNKVDEIQNFVLFKELRFGKIYNYKNLDEFWYYDQETLRIRFITKRILKLILEWNNESLILNEKQFKSLESIQGLPRSKYTISPKDIEFPCKVKLKNGEIIDFCILLTSKCAPFQNYYKNVIMLSEVDEIIESEYSLPHSYRISSMNAKEIMMSTYPFVLKTHADQNLIYNGKTQFASFGEIKGKEIEREIEFSQSVRGKFIDNDYEKLTYIVADWDDRMDKLYEEYHLNIFE